MIKVKIYTKEHCPACMMTKKLFNKLGVDYKEVTVLQDSPMLEVLRKQGWHSFPVVEWLDEEGVGDAWSGFKPDNIKEIAGWHANDGL